MVGGSGYHAALFRDVQNGAALGVTDFAVSPGDFDQRRQDERRARVERDAELLDSLQQRGLIHVKFVSQRLSNLPEVGILSQLFDQLGVVLAEIGFFLGTLTVTEHVLRHTTSNRRSD